MTDQLTRVPPVLHSIRVPVEPARAFAVFTTRVRDWWIPEYSANPTKAPIAEIVIEPRAGGRWYERDVHGREYDWARVLAWEPPERLLVEWQLPVHPTHVEVRFNAPAPRATNVSLLHRGFECYGDDAVKMRDMHDGGWGDLLRRYGALLEEGGHAHSERDPAGAAHAAARAITDGETILATVDIPAPPERIFHALTTAECEEWWGAPETYRVTDWRADLRVGGQWSLVVRLPDGGAFPASGRFLEIESPRRIVQTRRYDWDYPELGQHDTTVTYLLEPLSSGTRVTVRQDGFAGLRGPAHHLVEGWEEFLGYLANYLVAELG